LPLPPEKRDCEMNNRSQTPTLKIDVSAALPVIGDRKKVEDSADLEFRDGFDVEFKPGAGVSWSLELRRIAGAVEVSGTVVGAVTLLCFRCLEEFSFPLSLGLREHALWLNGAEGEPDEETSPDYMVVDGELDLEPILRDAIVLAFPVRRVCSEECKGLCVDCGANLNLEPCECVPRPADVRFSPLAELKKRMESRASEQRP